MLRHQMVGAFEIRKLINFAEYFELLRLFELIIIIYIVLCYVYQVYIPWISAHIQFLVSQTDRSYLSFEP